MVETKKKRWYDRLLYFGLALAVLAGEQASGLIMQIFQGIIAAAKGMDASNVEDILKIHLPAWQIGILIVIDLIIIGLSVWLLKHYKLIHKEGLNWKLLIGGLLLGYIAMLGINTLGSWLMELQGKSDTANQTALEEIAKASPFIYMLIFTGFVAPITEELTFRGFFQKGIFDNTWWGYLLVSLLFGLFHFPDSWGALVTYVGMGLVIGWFTYRYNRLEYSIALHMLNNIISTIIIYAMF